MTSSTTWIPAVGARGFDTSAAVQSQTQAQQIFQANYVFAIRYVTLPGNPTGVEPLTTQEAGWLRTAGIAVGLVQPFRTQSTITAAQGTTDGQSAAAQAQELGVPGGVVIWADVEGIDPSECPIVQYLQSWAAAVSAGGYAPGVYNAALQSSEFAQLTTINHYWQSGAGMEFAGNLGNPGRGYQILQLNPPDQMVADLAIDVDVAQKDNQQWEAVFWAPSV